MKDKTQPVWEIIARAHDADWDLYEPRTRVGLKLETERELAPDGMTLLDEEDEDELTDEENDELTDEEDDELTDEEDDALADEEDEGENRVAETEQG